MALFNQCKSINNLAPLQIAVSACLLGRRVRHDGGHRYNQHLVSQLSEHFTLLGICPELAIGLGVPRATMALVQEQNKISILAVDNPDQDYTQDMINYSQDWLRLNDFSGLVLKDRSPSCGVSNTPIYNKQKQQTHLSHGLFTQTIMASLPDMPIISAEQLQQPGMLIKFIDDVKKFSTSDLRQ